jgi:hypothetical protein
MNPAADVLMGLATWLAGSVAAAAVIGRGIRIRDEREPERV